MISDFISIQMSFIVTQSGNIQTSSLHRLTNCKFLSEQRSRIFFIEVLNLFRGNRAIPNPLSFPIRRCHHRSFPISRFTPRRNNSILIINTYFPIITSKGFQSLSGIMYIDVFRTFYFTTLPIQSFPGN